MVAQCPRARSHWNAGRPGAAASACASSQSGGNALGELKILFPNCHAIYMQDTPSKSLFSRDTRAYSHGCIRLEGSARHGRQGAVHDGR